MVRRILNTSKSHSFFLFGARGTGKTTFIKNQFREEEVFWIDLLETSVFAELQARPDRLAAMAASHPNKWIVIDEVQKVPALLDEVHRLIQSKKRNFVLTGSSARKLKRDGANLLAGRAFVFNLFPLTQNELEEKFSLNDVLSYGSLPNIFQLNSHRDKSLFLKAYAETYLREEILIEQLIRKLPPFRKFLEISAHQDTELISLTNMSRDILVDPKIVSNYYSILEDTLLGFVLESFDTSIRRRQKRAPKFYWFDTGVRRALAGTIDEPVRPKSFEYGSLFESFIVNECHRRLVYSEKSFKQSFLRLDEKNEIDLIIERKGLPTYLIEIKSSDVAHEGHIQSVKKFQSEIKSSKALLFSNDPVAKVIEGVSCLHWLDGLKEIGL